MPQAVIFDMDGVLVASGPAHAASWKAVGRKHGLQITDEQFKATFGQPSRDIIRALLGERLSDAEIKAVDDEKETIYRDLITGMVPLTIGTKELLFTLRDAGFVLAVATSGPPENVELVLREKNLAPFFTTLVTGFDIQHGKPAPDCFLLAAERLGASPRDCVVIEDAPVGIQAAQAANMAVVALAGTHSVERLKQSGPSAIVERMADITPALVHHLLA